ncbi:MAG: TetR/AcrR family transcriptional regulator [Actinomycetota bacterium]|nr:TetR/AcrR family transcriptional regulator [Actinomycetota bacterium]
MTTQARSDPYAGSGPAPSLTRARILEAAARLFYRRGIRAVSVDELAESASVTKVTVYKHFRSKDNLVASCLHMLDDRFFAWFVTEVEASSEHPDERLLAVFDVLDRWFRRRGFRGCAFINATVELAEPTHPAHLAVLSHKDRSRAYFRELAVAAGVDNPDDLSDQWMLLSEGATVTALVEDDRHAARRARKAAESLLAAARRPSPARSRS